MFWFLTRKQWFYDPDKCDAIISKYNGTKEMQVLRALAAMDLMPSDIKRFYAYGKCGVPADETYKLINLLDQEIYTVKRHESGSNHSLLKETELIITDGKGVIKEYWVCA